MAERRVRFRLWKYYLDCVSPAGDVCIAYVAGLRWGPVSVRYAALLESATDGTTRERHRYVRAPQPAVGNGCIAWQCAPLGVRGEWLHAAPRHAVTLLDAPAGRITWELLADRAEARVERPGAAALAGWGYVERLELTVEPWRLPFHSLHWGRFHSGEDALVWIGWDGDVGLRYVLHNGELLGSAAFGEQALRFGTDRQLCLDDRRILRDAPVVAALDRLPRLLRRVPPPFMTAREVKWLSRARLSAPGRAPASGWALHETVQFRMEGGR